MKTKVTIELEYDLKSLRFMLGEDFPESEFSEQVEEMVYADLTDLMRSGDLSSWAKIEESK